MMIIAVLALDGVLPFDLSVPGQVFGTANATVTAPHYDIRVCAPDRSVTTSAEHGAFQVGTEWGLEGLDGADTVIVPGHAGFLDRPSPPVAAALDGAAGRGARMASVCIGAFTLAAVGLLDGKRATTHWQHAEELARRHPRVDVDGDVLFIDEDDVVTSAGVAAGLDLCLHLVRRDLGAQAAAATARRTVMPLQRDGGQAQFVEHRRPRARDSTLQPTLHWMETELHRPLTLEDIAAHAGMSVRHLNRRFREQTGTTPLQWLLRARMHRAQELLEATALPVERVADRSGFGTAATLRHHFARLAGTSPQAYRNTFRGPAGPSGPQGPPPPV
ncbi:GlxA family transcriptional regulator [Nocardiopsis chromatogenes]|uniref:GlxA family transcriptional regulator n=1 Tax=Nocardiopsis chromatogenes TaxID=280239 RepID=UPI00034BF455|nr:helix-turn-helix domain-containing protein [Nocardiopsis chromatogenes]